MDHIQEAAFVSRKEAARMLGPVVASQLAAGAGPGEMTAAADFMGPGAIEINRYQTEITDMVRRRYVLGQRINQTLATGQPSRYFEQVAIPTGAFVDPRILSATATQPQRVEKVISLKAITGQINYGLFDVEVNQQQGQFAYLEAKDLHDLVDGVLKLHDGALWTGTDTDTMVPTTTQYYGISGQVFAAASTSSAAGGPGITAVASTGSLVDTAKTVVATIANRTDFETRPSAFYAPPLMLDLFDKEAKTIQLTFNEVEVIPGVVVKAIPTQMGLLPLIGDPSITIWPYSTQKIYTGFILSEDMVEYHYLTDALPRVFQLGLLGNLAAQYVVVKFGAVLAKGASYAHTAITATR